MRARTRMVVGRARLFREGPVLAEVLPVDSEANPRAQPTSWLVVAPKYFDVSDVP